MLPVLTAAQMAELDKYTIERLGLDSKLLMSNAARASLRVIRSVLPGYQRPVILAGTGNNGGDGVALAYYAHQSGMRPLLLLCHPEITDPPSLSLDSSYFYNICEAAYVPRKMLNNPAVLPEILSGPDCDLVVDALFGTGIDRPLGEYYQSLIDRLNLTSNPLVAIDCPSGLNCTTGEVMERAIEADLTITMGYAKRGFFHPEAARYTGDLHVVELGFAGLGEAGVAPESHAWPDALWEPLRLPRRPDTHKGSYGRVLIVAGHKKFPGAPRLAAGGAQRSGAGLTRLVVPEDIHLACCDDPAVMTDSHPTDGRGGFAAEPSEALLEHLGWADALVVGPGLSDGEAQQQFVKQLLAARALPVVRDADGLRALPLEDSNNNRRWPLVLTPHAGELARLAGVIPDVAVERWFELAARMAFKHDAFVLAKSNQPVIASPEGALIFPLAGPAALATGGTGDVLSGIIGALLARCHAAERDPHERMRHDPANLRATLAEIIASAVNIHSTAAELLVEDQGEEGLSPFDLHEEIPHAILQLRETYEE